MKKALILFAVLFTATLLTPLLALTQNEKNSDTNEMATLFSSQIGIIWYAH